MIDAPWSAAERLGLKLLKERGKLTLAFIANY
jgi:hypothetical protein